MRTAARSIATASRRGSAVAMALVCVTVVAGLAVAFLQITTSATSRQVNEIETLRAFYLAEAGLAESFQALRIGRTGQVGSETEPAAAGNGLLWVDAAETADGQVRLESTALVGTGRATLALIVEPIEIPLGFFSDEDLVVESVLMVDGFDSTERTYSEEIAAIGSLQSYAQSLVEIASKATLLKHLSEDKPTSENKFAAEAKLNEADEAQLVEAWPDLLKAFQAGTLFPEEPQFPIDQDPIPIDHTLPVEPSIEYPDRDISEAQGLLSRAQAGGNGRNKWEPNPGDADPVDANPIDADPGGSPDIPTPELPTEHTTDGGVVGSNGNIVFDLAGDEPVSIFGDIVPGPGATVQGLANVNINGETESRPVAVELPAVDVPVVEMNPATLHDDLLPMVVSPGTSGFESISVAPGAELILRGPATIIIGDLIVQPGATLTLDTRDGDVSLFVTGGMDLQVGSTTATTTALPDQTTVQVAGIASGAGGAPVKLESTAQFHGTIYAPETEVYVGSNFEIYGGIVARKLEIGPGAKLHFDNAGFEGTPIPRLVSWQIVEIKSAARNRSRNVFKALGVNPATAPRLTEAHDLSQVDLKLEYVALDGTTQSFIGLEEDFDWGLATDIVAVSRDATREQEDGSVSPPVDPETEPGPDAAVTDLINDVELSSSELATALVDQGVLSISALREVILRDPPLGADDLYSVLEKNGPVMSGFPTAESPTPIPDSLLIDTINSSSLDSKSLSWVLEQNSPLDPAVLQAARDRNPPMKTTDLRTVERAQ